MCMSVGLQAVCRSDADTSGGCRPPSCQCRCHRRLSGGGRRASYAKRRLPPALIGSSLWWWLGGGVVTPAHPTTPVSLFPSQRPASCAASPMQAVLRSAAGGGVGSVGDLFFLSFPGRVPELRFSQRPAAPAPVDLRRFIPLEMRVVLLAPIVTFSGAPSPIGRLKPDSPRLPALPVGRPGRRRVTDGRKTSGMFMRSSVDQ